MSKAIKKYRFVWPDLVVMEFLTAVALTIILLVWALLINAPLLEVANPGISENPARAPWYFVGLQELLVYFDPWIAGVVIPAVIITALVMIPYLDNNPRGSGGYDFAARRFAVLNFLVGFTMWWVFIIIGCFLRGPDWRLTLPWPVVGIGTAAERPLGNLDPLTGGAGIAVYFIAGTVLPAMIWKDFRRRCGTIRYLIVMIILLMMYAVPIKIVLRLLFDIRYVLVTPWFNI